MCPVIVISKTKTNLIWKVPKSEKFLCGEIMGRKINHELEFIKTCPHWNKNKKKQNKKKQTKKQKKTKQKKNNKKQEQI